MSSPAMFQLKKTALVASLVSSSTFAASFALSVNLSDSIRPVTHVASGSLYGLTESLPGDYANLVAPLKPNMFTQPALSGTGHQQGVAAAAVPISAKLASTTGKVTIRLADVLPGWPYTWSGQASWLASVTTVINAKLASGRSNYYGYEIFNEPNDTWKTANGDFHATCWKPTYDLIRKLDPSAKIIGPAYSYYNSTSMKTFLTYCKANNCLPDIICWHQWGSAGISSTIDSYRALETSLGITPRAISLNEYSSSTHAYEGSPGVSVPFIAKFERKGVESACISWWFTGLPGRLGSLLTSSNAKGGGWWMYKWYGDMTGAMVKTVPPNDASEGVDAFAALDKTTKVASIVLGGNSIGTVNVSIGGIPSSFGTSVNAKLEYVTWADKDTPVTGTTVLSSKSYAVVNSSISVPVEVTNQFYAYRIQITPAASTSVPPVIKITAPLSTGSFTAGTPITVDVTASDADGTVAHIDFYDGATAIHSEWVAPYAWEWTDATAGTHVLKAVATDNDGNTAQDSMTLTVKSGPVGIAASASRETLVHQVYDIQGNRLGAIVTDGSRSLDQAVGRLVGRSGIYFAHHATADGVVTRKVEVP